MADDLDRRIASYAKKLNKIKSIEVPRANASALNKVAKTIRARSVKGLNKETRIPQKLLRKRVFLGKATAKKQTAEIKNYVKPVPASALLTKNQIATKLGTGTNRRGVKAKGYEWRGAFIQPGKNENIQVFKRRSNKRLPVEAIKVPIDSQAQIIVPKVARRAMKSNYRRILENDLRFRLRKYEVT